MQVGADDGVAAHHPVLDAGQVHRAALAAEQAGAPSEHLGDDRSGGTPGDGVAVAAVGGERVVVGRRPRRTPPPPPPSSGEVAGALDEVLQEQVVEALLELADLLLAAVQLQARVDVDVGVVELRVERLGQDRRGGLTRRRLGYSITQSLFLCPVLVLGRGIGFRAGSAGGRRWSSSRAADEQFLGGEAGDHLAAVGGDDDLLFDA